MRDFPKLHERLNKTDGIVGILYKQNHKLKSKNKGNTSQRNVSLKKKNYFISLSLKTVKEFQLPTSLKQGKIREYNSDWSKNWSKTGQKTGQKSSIAATVPLEMPGGSSLLPFGDRALCTDRQMLPLVNL